MIRQYYLDSKELKEKIENLETEMNMKFKDINQTLNFLLNPKQPEINYIGFDREIDE